MKVPFIDLVRQYKTIEDEVNAALHGVLTRGHFILGPNVEAFEREMAEYCGVSHAIGVASGTDALRIALQAAGVGAGHEVITSAFTFIATAEVISQLGAQPVFADIDPVTLALQPERVAERITARTRAIVPVHLYGQPADMPGLLRLAERHGLTVVEDAAQAIGAEHRGRRVGSLGHLGCFSFFPTKNLGAYGDGGLVTTSDATLADRVRMLRQHGSRTKYFHESLGWSSRLDELQAAILRVKLRYLEDWTERRREHARRYRERLVATPLQLPPEQPDSRMVYHLFTVRTPRRDELGKFLGARGIQTMVHYPIPLHLQPPYRQLGVSLPETERASNEVVSLPIFPDLEKDEVDAVCAAVVEFFSDLERG